MAEPHVVSALVRKRAELAGEIEAAEKRAARLRADLLHLDATLRLFDTAAEPLAIPPKRPWRRTGWFRNGELPRRVLDTLRAAAAAGPLCAGEITARIMADKGLEPGGARVRQLVAGRPFLRRQRPQSQHHGAPLRVRRPLYGLLAGCTT